MELVKPEHTPIRHLEDEQINTLILAKGGLSDWICTQLSIKNTPENQSRILALLPEIKYHCLSLTVPEIQKAIQMYVRGELNLDPVDNYLTPIQFGRIIKAYKQTRKPERTEIKPIKLSIMEIRENIKANILLAYDQLQEQEKIDHVYVRVFHRMYEMGIFPRIGMDPKADARYQYYQVKAYEAMIHHQQRILESRSSSQGDRSRAEIKLEQYTRLRYSHPDISDQAALMALEGYFSRISREDLIQVVDDHLKNIEQ